MKPSSGMEGSSASKTVPFTADDVAEWAAFGPKLLEKPATPEDLQVLRSRKLKMTSMKKRLAEETKWSERAIERELNRLVEQLKSVDTTPAYQLDNKHPDNIKDHRRENGPLLNLLWSKNEPLHGQTLYLGGEVGSDGKIYCIPGHASKVLLIDTETDEVTQIGPELTSNGRLYKWLRGIVVGDIIYGLPCHADEILKIHVPSHTVTKLPIPYETFYSNPEEAKEEREMIWKYHGGTICPIDDCIYAIPQRAHHVLKFDPKTETVSFHGPKLEGYCKWYGGILGKQDGAIYGIPQNASGVLRITPDSVTVHGDFGENQHNWHGGAAATNGVIVSVPANASSCLCITPGDPPSLKLIGDSDVIKSGRHRNDGKYKYLGAMCGTNGKVYIFPCASEYVLQVDTEKMEAKNGGESQCVTNTM